ncbi:MAG: queuosine precursor transporter [Planctomycetes bacterium]|nr:queuosine precursor transporter [Planctomycetota bacterium]
MQRERRTFRAPSTARGARKREVLLLALGGLFVGFFVAAEILGNKLYRFDLFGLTPRSIGLSEDAYFVATTGIYAFPLTFILTDIVNEYFGKRVVRVFTWLAIAVNVLLQVPIWFAARAPAVSFTPGLAAEEVQSAFQIALGATWAIVVASLCAFSISQFVDATVFTFLRHRTGGRMLWLRSQGSTVVSQLIDTLVVIFLAFWVIPELLGNEHMTARQALVVSVTNYVYKFAIAVGITPLLYGVHWAVQRYLGRDVAHRLAHEAHPVDPD